jgi:hypothetical protein
MRNLNPTPFFFGIAVSIAVLAITGWEGSKTNIFKNFTRFHIGMSPESLFYPTAREVVALAERKTSKDKIAVIIGGSSVIRGTGQSEGALWSATLQKELGQNYTVLNLALNGGAAGGQASYISEYLVKAGYKIIFVADNNPFVPAVYPDNIGVYSYMFFDALERGIIDNYPARLDYVRDISYRDNFDVYMERRIAAFLNKGLNFNDAWSFIGYRHVFTIWSPLVPNATDHILGAWQPRKMLNQDESGCASSSRYRPDLFDPEMRAVIGATKAAPLSNPQIAGLIDRQIAATFPDALRPHMILAFKTYSPYYTSHLSPEEKDIFVMRLDLAKQVYESHGISSVVVNPDFDSDDFCDRDHLSDSGAPIYADILAGAIREKSKELGYE